MEEKLHEGGFKMADTIYKGKIQGFEGSWGSGLAQLIVKDSRTGEIKSLSCDNAQTVRSLEAAFGDTIGEGHTVNPKGAYVGKEIYYSMESWGGMVGFQPVEEASEELENHYESQFQNKAPKTIAKKKGWKLESSRHALARKGIKTGRKKKVNKKLEQKGRLILANRIASGKLW